MHYTFSGSNQNILQTVTQVVDLETQEIEKALQALRSEDETNRADAAANSGTCPHGYLCPISLSIMKDPVIAMDGHSYERASIEQWFQSHNTSPVTNLPIQSTTVIDNISLRSAISDYLQAPDGNPEPEDVPVQARRQVAQMRAGNRR